MKNILTIIKKEFARFFRDKRMVITIFVPGILIFILYSVLGTIVEKMADDYEDYTPTAAVFGMPESLDEAFNALLDVCDDDLNEEQAKERVAAGTLDLVIVFPEDFESVITSGAVGDVSPNVAVYYNSSSDDSLAGYTLITGVFEELNRSKFTVNANGTYDLATERDMAEKILSTVIPMLMFALFASACVAVAPEAIAGEKERGTMATMLITPVKRWQIALGKIISLSCFAMFSGISSFLGVMLSLPKLMGGLIGAQTAGYYTAGDYFMIFGLIISVLLVIISAFSILSAFAKSVKEAGTMIAPLMMVIILLGICSMFVSSTPSLGLFAIPLLGSALAISGIMSISVSGLAVGLSIGSNFLLAAVLITLLAFMFKSEKIMFNR